MSALSTTCQRSVGTELSLVDVGSMEDLLDQIRTLQHQVSSLQQELNQRSEERRLTRAGLDGQKQQMLQDCVGALSVCGVEQAASSSSITPGIVCKGEELQEGVSGGEEGAEPLQGKDEHTVHTPLKACSVKLVDCRMAWTLDIHIKQEEADDARVAGDADDSEVAGEAEDSGVAADSGDAGDADDSGVAGDADDSGVAGDADDSGVAGDADDSGVAGDADDSGVAGYDEFDMSFLDKWWKRSRDHGKKSSVCSMCGNIFSQPSTLRTHMRTHTGDTLLRCACGKIFSYTSSLTRHQKACCPLFSDSRNDRKVPPVEPRQYQCSFCGKQFTTKGHVTIHERLHTGKKPYECSECEQAFVRADRLKEHQRVHTREKPYECSYCRKQFALLGGLKVHHRTHTGEKPYKCTVCKKRFTQSTKLKIHLRTHTGERPYPCSECGKAFTRTEHLRTHQKIHSGGKRHGRAPCRGRGASVACPAKQTDSA